MSKHNEIEHEYEDVENNGETKTVEPLPSPNSKFKRDRAYMFDVIARNRSWYNDDEILETEDLEKVLQVMPFDQHQANILREAQKMAEEIAKMFEHEITKKKQPKEWVYYARLKDALLRYEIKRAPLGQWKGMISVVDFQMAVDEALTSLKPGYTFDGLDFFRILRQKNSS